DRAVWLGILGSIHYVAVRAWGSDDRLSHAAAAAWFLFFIAFTLHFLFKLAKKSLGFRQEHDFIETRDISSTLRPEPSRKLFEAPRHWMRSLGRHNDFFFPVFLEQTVQFKDLPPAFDGFTFLHISDIHY